jgi:hypothetical protein
MKHTFLFISHLFSIPLILKCHTQGGEKSVTYYLFYFKEMIIFLTNLLVLVNVVLAHERRLALTFMLMVVAFFVCYLPATVLNVNEAISVNQARNVGKLTIDIKIL